MTCRAYSLFAAFLVPLSALFAQTPQDTIGLAAARSTLGTDPLAVPGLPVRSLHRLSKDIILVEQQLPSGGVVAFREWRGRPWRFSSDSTPSAAADQREATFAALNGQPLPAEKRWVDRRRLRWFGGLAVEVMSEDQAAIDLLDRLQPLKS